MHTAHVFFVALISRLDLAGALPGINEVRQATNGPRPGTIIWVCTGNQDSKQDIPEVCTNMCYGAFCRGYGTSLTWDNYAGNSKDTRAANAGCGRNNHCATDPPVKGKSYQCDEYPFGSTKDADRTDKKPVNRYFPTSDCI